MENKKISPVQIPFLVRLTADLFREMNEEIKSPNNNPANKLEENKEMHFVADLLSDLVDIAYPEETIKSIKIEDEMIKAYVPPTEGKGIRIPDNTQGIIEFMQALDKAINQDD